MSEDKECHCHEHGEECHCHDHDHEHTSIEEAGGCAAGFTGTIENFNSDAEMRLADALMAVGKYVQGESGCLLGHIKAAVYTEEGSGLTLNLIDMDNGVEHHGTLPRADHVKFNFMCAVLDVDEHELTHEMMHAIDDSGLDYKIDPESLHHHHHHDDDDDDECEVDEEGHHHHHHEGECHCHDHHHDDDEEECHCHHHHHHDDDDEEECHCHDHHHHEDGECHCHDHEEKEEEKPKKKGFFSRFSRKDKKD